MQEIVSITIAPFKGAFRAVMVATDAKGNTWELKCRNNATPTGAAATIYAIFQDRLEWEYYGEVIVGAN